MDTCVLCSKDLSDGQETVALRSKGCESLKHASKERGDEIGVVPGQTVHKKCRVNYINVINIAAFKRKSMDKSDASSPRVMRSDKTFNFDTDCMFCGVCTKSDQFNYKSKVFKVRTFGFQNTILEICQHRRDTWSDNVCARIQYAQDLHAADAIYHQECSVNFRTDKQIPKMYVAGNNSYGGSTSSKRLKLGRPSDEEKNAAFIRVTKYLEENDEEQNSITDLMKKMGEYLKETEWEPYSFNHMKQRLMDTFGDRIIITEINGKQNVVTFKTTASAILHQFYSMPKNDDPDTEKRRLVEAAAKLIKNDIKSTNEKQTCYPCCEEMSSVAEGVEFLPTSLNVLLHTLFVGKDIGVKVASIGQAIMQAMHRQFGSRFLIDSLYKHGFSASYAEVQRYERSAAANQGTEIQGFIPGGFVQHVADNVDHNIRTIDGFNTFHGMGIIAAVTPGTQSSKPTPKLTVSSDDILNLGRINISFYKPQNNSMASLKYGKLQILPILDDTCNADLLWKTSWLLKSKTPSWNGFMQMVEHGPHPGKSSVVFMPMIDLKSSDETCIYSTMNFVSEQAKQYDVTPILTFDQPLWWKAFEIQQNEPSNSAIQNIVLRLGGLHIEMSFLGSIGHLMGGSGLQELLEIIYADTAVVHILSGKAISRAIRGHILIEEVLNSIMLSKVYDVPLPSTEAYNSLSEEETSQLPESAELEPSTSTSITDSWEDIFGYSDEGSVESDIINPEGETQNDLTVAEELLRKLLSNEIDIHTVCSDNIFDKIRASLDRYKTSLANRKTASLWMQYLGMVELLRLFIKAERTGNWALHLYALSEMLPYFASSGHNLYAKSVYLYLYSMSQLEVKHHNVFKSFQEGYHVVRRSDRYWAGLSTDLVIEQMLMRSMKTSGGLTRGRGMTEVQRTVWLLSNPACAEVNQAMQELTGVLYTSSEQHKDSSNTRISRDFNDMTKLARFLETRNPFSEDPSLGSIASGVLADQTVNVDSAKEIGKDIVKSMEGSIVNEYSFKKKKQAITLNSKVAVKINDETVHVDPQLLFQRLVSAARGMIPNEELSTLFTYELCTYPPALFDKDGLLRAANKPQLAEALGSCIDIQSTAIPADVQYVLDGGALLQRIPWPRGITYDGICNLYAQYIINKYGSDAVVVFDGYSDEPSTKDTAHLRRNAGQVGKTIHFLCDMTVHMKKDIFLANSKNKQSFICMLSQMLNASGIKTHQALGDADVLIVTTDVEHAASKPTV